MTPDDQHDPVLQQLRVLPTHDLAPEKAEQLRRQMRAELRGSGAQPAWAQRFTEWWNDVLEPLVAATFIVIYASWGVQAAAALVHEDDQAHAARRSDARAAALASK